MTNGTRAGAPLLRLAPGDTVAVATRPLTAGEAVELDGVGITLRDDVPKAHKVALADVAKGEQVIKYGQSIGRATRPIAAGEHVHVHNLGYVEDDKDYQFATQHTELPTRAAERTYEGYVREDGRVGTRNYVAIVTSVNCSASTAKMIARQVEPALAAYPNVDGVIALTHGSGCGMIPSSPGGQTLIRTLRGYASHPNIGGVLVLGLGCEMLQVDFVCEAIPSDTLVEHLTIQESGGIRATVRAGAEAIERMLPMLNERRRTTVPLSTLRLGLNCGGSDGYSGITANPALGVASDLIVGAGGVSVLAEVPEVFGAESLLTRRAVTPEVGKDLVRALDWWRDYARNGGGSLDNNPSPGNHAGGLTTILEKSLGAVAKAGQADLSAVVDYAEPLPDHGLVLMNTPGYDPVSVTGLIAGGCTVVVFTTGRGSVIGSRPAPIIKVATNTEMYDRMSEDMDINAGRIVDGTAGLEEVGEEILDEIIAVASGRASVSEEMNLGQEEFVPWQLGAVT